MRNCAALSLLASRQVDPLELGLWTKVGLHTGRVIMSRPVVPGPIILAHDGVSLVASTVGLGLIRSRLTDCLVRAEILITGWNFGTFGDSSIGGAAGRMSGTLGGASNWSGYFGAVRQFNGTTRRYQPRRVVAGTPNNFGTETTGLPSTWVDGTTHILTETEMAGTSIITRAKIVGAGSWAHDDAAATDANVTGPGMVGILCHQLHPSMTISLYSFEVET
jgi:hypothetical protein